jgi:hypothetical protein
MDLLPQRHQDTNFLDADYADYADFADFLATKMHKIHKGTKNIDTNFLDADYADYTDFVLAGLVFSANSALKASIIRIS